MPKRSSKNRNKHPRTSSDWLAAWRKAILSGNKRAVRELLDACSNKDMFMDEGWTPLALAINVVHPPSENQRAIVRMIIEARADRDLAANHAAEMNGMFPLVQVAWTNNTEFTARIAASLTPAAMTGVFSISLATS